MICRLRRERERLGIRITRLRKRRYGTITLSGMSMVVNGLKIGCWEPNRNIDLKNEWVVIFLLCFILNTYVYSLYMIRMIKKKKKKNKFSQPNRTSLPKTHE